MYQKLVEMSQRPAPFEFYTAAELWTEPYVAEQMLKYHLNGEVDVSSRNSAFIKRSVAWIGEHFKLGENKAVIDFGCGPGLYTHKLAQTGADITGVDFSISSLEYARKQAEADQLAINYVHQNYLEFETDKKFDLITMIMCDFCALSPEQRATLLGKFKKMLKSEGSVLLDVYSLIAFDSKEELAGYERNLLGQFWSPNDYFGFVNSFKYETEKVILDQYTIIEPKRSRMIYNWLQYFSRESIKAEFEQNGLTIRNFLGDVAGAEFDPFADEFAVIAGL